MFFANKRFIFITFSSFAPHRGQPAAKCHPRWQPTRRLAVSCGLGRRRIRTRDCRTTIEPPTPPNWATTPPSWATTPPNWATTPPKLSSTCCQKQKNSKRPDQHPPHRDSITRIYTSQVFSQSAPSRRPMVLKLGFIPMPTNLRFFK